MVVDQTLSDDAVHDPERPGRRADRSAPDELSTRTFVGALGGVLVVQLVICLYLLRNSYFFSEDFTFLAIYQDVPVTADLLRTSIFGHLIPGFILTQKYFGAWFGADWGMASVVTLAVQLGGTIAFARLLLALVGRRTWWVVWLTTAFGLSVVVLNTAPWWAATATMQITMVAAISAWGCTLRYARTRQWRYLLSLAVMYTVSVSFFEKSIATSAYLGLFVLLVGTADDERLRARFRRALGLWPAWVVIGVITLADLAIYFAGPYLDEAGEPAGLGVQAEYLARSLPEGAFPTLIGSVYPVSDIPGPDLLTVVVATAVCLGVVVWTSVRSRLALRVWFWYFLVIFFSQALVARGRLSLIDVDTVVHNLRYQGDAVYLFVIGVAVAVPAAVRAGSSAVRRRVTVAAVVAPLLALPLWAQSVHSISANTPGRTSRDFFAQLRSGDLPPDARFLDLPVPGWVIPTQMYPWNTAGRVYPVVHEGTAVTNDPDGALWIRTDGTIGPVSLRDETPPTTERVCVSPGEPPVPVLTAPEADRPTADPLLAALAYQADGKAKLQLSVGRGKVTRDLRGTGELFDVSGSGDLAAVIAAGPWRSIYVASAAGDVCVTSVRLVSPYG